MSTLETDTKCDQSIKRYAWTRTANGRRMRYATMIHTIHQNVNATFILQLIKTMSSKYIFSSLRHSSRFVPLSFARGRIVVIHLAVRSLCRLPWTSRGGSLRRGRGRLLLLAITSVCLRLLAIGSGHTISLLGRSVIALLLGLLITTVAALLLITATISAAAVAALLLVFCQIKG